MQKTAALNFIRVPYLMPVLFIACLLVKEGTEIEKNLKISKFQVLCSDSVISSNDGLILYIVE